MFSDERIILYIIACISALTIILKIFLGSASNFWFYASESFNLMVSLFILIIDYRCKPKDEREEEKKSLQLDNNFKYCVCLIYFWYAICAGVAVSLREEARVGRC